MTMMNWIILTLVVVLSNMQGVAGATDACGDEIEKCVQIFKAELATLGFNNTDDRDGLCNLIKGDAKAAHEAEKTCVEDALKMTKCESVSFSASLSVHESTQREVLCTEACKENDKLNDEASACMPPVFAALDQDTQLDEEKVCAQLNGNHTAKKCLKDAICHCSYVSDGIKLFFDQLFFTDEVKAKCPEITGMLGFCEDEATDRTTSAKDTTTSGDTGDKDGDTNNSEVLIIVKEGYRPTEDKDKDTEDKDKDTEDKGNGSGAVSCNTLVVSILASLLTVLTMASDL